MAHVVERVARLKARLAQKPARAESNIFRNDGDVWTVRYDGRDVCLKDGKGPRYLASLLAAPGRELHVLQFNAASGDARPAGIRDAGLSVGTMTDGDDAADEQARRAYRARLDDLKAELEEAEEFADHGRAERLREELELLMTELSGRFGGRAPRRGPAETARKAVTKVIRTQIGKLLEVHPALGRHLSETVRMGTVCVYAPQSKVDWDVEVAAR
jgi:hypothetical protein